MEVVFKLTKEPDIFAPTGWNGTDISCKLRTGQKNMQLTTEVTVELPDKVDAKWYAIMQGKLAGMGYLNSAKHDIRIFDRTPHLVGGYKRMQAELGMSFNTLTVNPNINDFAYKLGRGIIELKRLAKTYCI